MQGLLLVVTGGFQGLLRAGDLSSMPGSLARCGFLEVRWLDLPPNAERLWPSGRSRGAPSMLGARISRLESTFWQPRIESLVLRVLRAWGCL